LVAVEGFDPSTSVGLILNPTTKRIFPQFYLLYDDFFSTVQSIDRRDVPHDQRKIGNVCLDKEER